MVGKKKNQFDLDLAIEAFFQYQNEDRCFYGFGKTPFIFVGSSVYAFPWLKGKELIVELDNVLTARDMIKTVYQNSQLKNVSGQAQQSSSQIMLIYVHFREYLWQIILL